MVRWSASAQDQLDPGLSPEPVVGRLVVVRASRRGWRTQTLILFTSLVDAAAWPPARLLALYGQRWQVELKLRSLKSTLGLGQLEVKSAELARKEICVRLMAYNLVRGLMGVAARCHGVPMQQLTFAGVRTLLFESLKLLGLGWMPALQRWNQLEWMCREVARVRLPRRRKVRPTEPRAAYYPPQVYPRLRCSRAKARQRLAKLSSKS